MTLDCPVENPQGNRRGAEAAEIAEERMIFPMKVIHTGNNPPQSSATSAASAPLRLPSKE
mgnify:CR=1 FL=1